MDENRCLRIAGVVKESVVDGPGLRFVIFAQGCPFRCKGCHNPQAQPFEGGYLVSIDELIMEITNRRLLRGVTFSGGEPFAQAGAFALLGRAVREAGLDIVTYSGYTYEELLALGEEAIALLEVTNILIDGPYLEEKRERGLLYRGSANQRIIDVPRSLAEDAICLSPLHYGHSF